MRRFHPRRPLGRTGFAATRVGAGDLADRNVPIDECVATLARALDAGVNVVDTAPGYEEGLSERIVGRALRGRREAVFLIDKIDLLREPVAPQVTASLERLSLPFVDLFVFHACSTLEDWAGLVAPGGGFDQLRDQSANTYRPWSAGSAAPRETNPPMTLKPRASGSLANRVRFL